MTRTIKDFYGRVLGRIESTSSGATAYDFYGKILGKYDSRDDTTKDFYGKILYRGDCLSALIVLNSKGINP